MSTEELEVEAPLTAYTTGTKTGTATKSAKRDRKKASAASADDSEVSEWRPQGGAVEGAGGDGRGSPAPREPSR